MLKLSLKLSMYRLSIVGKPWKPVPPTPYYFSKRAEMYSASARKALAEGKVSEYNALMLKSIEYRTLAGQLPLEKEIHDDNIQTA
jgi:hypothetical protein